MWWCQPYPPSLPECCVPNALVCIYPPSLLCSISDGASSPSDGAECLEEREMKRNDECKEVERENRTSRRWWKKKLVCYIERLWWETNVTTEREHMSGIKVGNLSWYEWWGSLLVPKWIRCAFGWASDRACICARVTGSYYSSFSGPGQIAPCKKKRLWREENTRVSRGCFSVGVLEEIVSFLKK